MLLPFTASTLMTSFFRITENLISLLIFEVVQFQKHKLEMPQTIAYHRTVDIQKLRYKVFSYAGGYQ